MALTLSFEKSQVLLMRLESLEKLEKERKDEVNTLQRDFFSQQREILGLEKKNRSLEEKMDRQTADMRILKESNSKLQQKVDNLQKKTDQQDTQMTSLKDSHSELQTKVDRLEKKSNQMTKTDNKLKVDLNKEEEKRQQLYRVFNRAVVKGQDDIEPLKQHVTTLMTRTKAIEDLATQRTNSLTRLRMTTKGGGQLTTGQWVALDVCDKVYTNGGNYDTRTCCVVPQTGGQFILNVDYGQDRRGEISMRINSDGVLNYCIGETEHDDSVSSCTIVARIDKGQTIWLEAKRIQGTATIGWCDFCSWLV